MGELASMKKRCITYKAVFSKTQSGVTRALSRDSSPAKTIYISRLISFSLIVAVALILSSCTGDVNGVPEPRAASSNNIANGRRLMASYGCGSCHTIPGVPGANSLAGPPLKCFYQRTYIAGRLANTKENLMQWIQNPQQIVPGNAMPDLGVSKAEAGDIADYLYNPPAFWGLIASNVFERKCSE